MIFLLNYDEASIACPAKRYVCVHGGDGNLGKSVVTCAPRSIVNGTTTYYPSRQYVDIFQGGVETVQKYYTVGSQTIAENTVTNGVTTLNWILNNQVNSTTVTANADGSFYSAILYTAFGEIRASAGTTPTQFQFTGQLADSYIKLSWFNSRWYDSQTAQFVQPDSIIPGLSNSNVPTDGYAWDHYAYVGFNPITRNDPTGHKDCDLDCQQRSEPVDPQHIREAFWETHWDWAQQKKNSAIISSVAHGIVDTEVAVVLPPALPLVRDLNGEKVTGLDMGLSVLPGLGDLAGEAGVTEDAVKLLSEPSRTDFPWHHLLPRRADLAEQFAARGIDIEENLVQLPRDLHQLIHGGGPRGGDWNAAWEAFFGENPNATAEDVYKQVGALINQFGLDGKIRLIP